MADYMDYKKFDGKIYGLYRSTAHKWEALDTAGTLKRRGETVRVRKNSWGGYDVWEETRTR